MTIIRDLEKKCGVCGETSQQPCLTSTNTFGYPDLDLRPPEMQRSTMSTWIEECPNCGYVANDISDKPEIPEEFLKSEEYLTCSGYDFKSDLARKFYKNHLISRKIDDMWWSFICLQRCAWKCDDFEDPLAADIRKLAIEAADSLIENDIKDKEKVMLIRADMLRRTGQFDKLIEEYKNVIFSEAEMNMVIRYQIEKSLKRDDGCYTTEEIFGK